ncbi:hypothetical protein vBSscSF1_43 [Staphylococcus phage vB-SscS-F1]|nr:hypothetical protein vBApySJF1_43 [Arcanobacterium phage vB-ApyS-JF1]
MKKYNLIDKYHFYVDDNYNIENYFTTQFVLSCEADILLENMIDDCEDEHDKDNYKKLDTNNIDDIDYILECANVYIYPYNKTEFTY